MTRTEGVKKCNKAVNGIAYGKRPEAENEAELGGTKQGVDGKVVSLPAMPSPNLDLTNTKRLQKQSFEPLEQFHQ